MTVRFLAAVRLGFVDEVGSNVRAPLLLPLQTRKLWASE